MGIRGLHAFLKQYATKHAKTVYVATPLTSLAGVKLAIDCSEYIYVYHNVAKRMMFDTECQAYENGRWKPLDQGKLHAHVCGHFVSLVCSIRDAGVIPIFVFDGAAGEHKQLTKDDRKRVQLEKERLRDEAACGTCLETYRKRELACNVPGHEYKPLLSDLFTVLSVDFYHAEEESDTLCAQLCRNGVTSAVLSKDGDQFAYGTRMIVKKLTYTDGEMYAICTTSSSVASMLGLSLDQLTQLCVTCGTDYNDNVPRFGPVRNLVLMRKHGSIQEIVKAEPLFASLKYQDAYDIFTKPIPIPSPIKSDCTVDAFLQRWDDPSVVQRLRDMLSPSH